MFSSSPLVNWAMGWSRLVSSMVLRYMTPSYSVVCQVYWDMWVS